MYHGFVVKRTIASVSLPPAQVANIIAELVANDHGTSAFELGVPVCVPEDPMRDLFRAFPVSERF